MEANQAKTESQSWAEIKEGLSRPYKSKLTAEMVKSVESFRDVVREYDGAPPIKGALLALFATAKFLIFYVRKLENEILVERKRRLDLLETYLMLALGREISHRKSPINYNLRRGG